ncbi:7935_t:CDS:2 [Entrophospora sp. SA101]|nr:7935_t:CDS:2 [Entrophospora sp. SA101]
MKRSINFFTTPKQKENRKKIDSKLEQVTLRHIIHYGTNRYPNLIRRLDLNTSQVHLRELNTGITFTHGVSLINGTGVRPVRRDAIKEFQFLSQYKQTSSIIEWNDSVDLLLPNVTDMQTLISLAKMSSNAYIKCDDDDWYDLGKHYNLNSTFGWEDDGIRGYVFGNKNNSLMVIAIKGSSVKFNDGGPTEEQDRINDNRLFSCCCKIGWPWKPVCNCHKDNNECDLDCVQDSVDERKLYYNSILEMFENITKEYEDENLQVWLTGHSLGGTLGSLVGSSYGIPTVTFESPGDRMAASRLHLPRPPALPDDKMNIWHVGNNADSGYAMESKCHIGNVCLFEVAEKLDWNVNARNHPIMKNINEVLIPWEKDYNFTIPECKPEKDCVDCEKYKFV